MILFIVEGALRELQIFKTIEYLYFDEKPPIICSYCNNIYSLYKDMIETGFIESALSVLQRAYKKRNDHSLDGIKEFEVSEIYLFFDYDCHHQNKKQSLTLEELNAQLKTLLEFFSNETDNGKLYINYPMAEAIRYTKKLPDKNFINYEIKISESGKKFKEKSDDFSDYGNYDFICFRLNKRNQIIPPTLKKKQIVKTNWELLKQQNLDKVNAICDKSLQKNGKHEILNQLDIFNAQLEKYESKGHIAILSAFPIFLFDYFAP